LAKDARRLVPDRDVCNNSTYNGFEKLLVRHAAAHEFCQRLLSADNDESPDTDRLINIAAKLAHATEDRLILLLGADEKAAFLKAHAKTKISGNRLYDRLVLVIKLHKVV